MFKHDCRSDAALNFDRQSTTLCKLFKGEIASGKSEEREGLEFESPQSPVPLQARKHGCNTAPHAFGGVGLAEVLKDCRKRVFGIEKAQTAGKSLLEAYLPVRRPAAPNPPNQIQNQPEKKAGEILGKRAPRDSAATSPEAGSAEGRPDACESLSDCLGKSVKKLNLIELERRSEKVLSKYRPVFSRKTGREQDCEVGLEEMLRARKHPVSAALPGLAGAVAPGEESWLLPGAAQGCAKRVAERPGNAE